MKKQLFYFLLILFSGILPVDVRADQNVSAKQHSDSSVDLLETIIPSVVCIAVL